MLNCILASHLTPYRVYTLPQAVESINDMCVHANQSLVLYISYSYESGIDVDALEALVREKTPFITVVFYRHATPLLQFEHIRYIMTTASFHERDWILFHDDDDVSTIDRLSVLLPEMKDGTDILSSGRYNMERTTLLQPPYGAHEHFVTQQRYSYKEFGTFACRVHVLTSFLDECTTWTKFTDCVFMAYACEHTTYKHLPQPLYVYRLRTVCSDTAFLEYVANGTSPFSEMKEVMNMVKG